MGGLSKVLIGSQAFDKAGREIECYMTKILVGSGTTLVQPLVSGDTVIYVNSLAN